MIKHLVTSGCSFSDNFKEGRWPQFLAEALNVTLYNRGQGSCGNDWIARTMIYQLQSLLDSGVKPQEILAVVMWSGIDRTSLFISSKETINFKSLINVPNSNPNPINFLDESPNEICTNNHTDGFLVGSMGCNFVNGRITKLKRTYIANFLNDEALAIESYENFLKLQWFCENKQIKLINQTYMNIMHHPKYDYRNRNTSIPLTKDYYRNITHLYNMLDMSKWVFWNDTDGLFEYTLDNNLSFYSDDLHPLPESHKYYVDNFLLKQLTDKGVI